MQKLLATALPLALASFAFAQEETGKPVDFEKQIAPILIERCIECHGPKEQEGDLRLDAREHVFVEGDEDWWVVQPKDVAASELYRRLLLPLDDDEIMPAKGEPLSKEQQALFRRWIEQGAAWPAAGDEYIAAELEAQVLPKIVFELPEQSDAEAAAVAAAVTAVRELGGVVQRVAADTEALDVNLSLLRGKVTDQTLAALEPLAPRLVWLNLSRTAVGDAGMRSVARLTQLRRLNLSGTKVGDRGFAALQPLARLEYLNAYGTGLGDAGLRTLATLPALGQIYAWQTGVSKQGVAALQQHFAKVEVDLGDYVEERLAKAQQEIEAREARNKPANEVCPVTGKKVDAAHFSVHDGKRIAFCCPKCKAAFDKEPAKFAAKVAELVGGAAAGKLANSKCPVSGKPADAAHTSRVDGKLIGFCCARCKAKFDADPAKFADKLGGK